MCSDPMFHVVEYWLTHMGFLWSGQWAGKAQWVYSMHDPVGATRTRVTLL